MSDFDVPWGHLPNVSWEYLAKVKKVMDELYKPKRRRKKKKRRVKRGEK